MPRKKSQNIQANGGWRGPGKVHYNAEGATLGWMMTLCGITVFGEFVPADENPVTCKRCLKAVPG